MLRFLLLLLIFLLSGLLSCAPVQQQNEQSNRKADVHYKLAMAHLQANNPTAALQELLAAVQKEPQNSAIQVALAQAYHQKNALQLAERHYLKALEIEPDEPRYQNNLGALYLDMKQWDKAIRYFDRAASNLLFMNSHVAMTGKAYAYYQKGDYQNALRNFAEVISLNPRYVPAYLHQSRVYRSLGEVGKERKSLENAIAVAPQFMQARYRLAELLQQQRAYGRAQEQLLTIIEFAPQSEWGRQAQELLQDLPTE